MPWWSGPETNGASYTRRLDGGCSEAHGAGLACFLLMCVFGLPLGTLMSRIHRVRKHLRAKLAIQARQEAMDGEALPQTHGESRVVESIPELDSLSQIPGIDWITGRRRAAVCVSSGSPHCNGSRQLGPGVSQCAWKGAQLRARFGARLTRGKDPDITPGS